MRENRILRVVLAAAVAAALLASCGTEAADGGGSGESSGIFGNAGAGNSKTETLTLYDSQIGEQDGYSYELWKDSGDTTMNLTGEGKFSCEWHNINNCLFRTGKKFDCTQTFREIGNIAVDYEVDYQPDGNSYLCLYGWTREPLIEYYVVESWGSWRPPGGVPLGSYEADGGTYEVYRTLRVNQPSIDGNTTFEQFWSVRTEKRTSGTVNASTHFAAWEALGMNMGKMYEAALTVEGYQSAGKAEVLKNVLTLGGEIAEPDLPEPPPPQEPDENGIYFLSDFEDGADGWSSRGDAKLSSTDEAAFEGTKSLKVTGRRDAWQGACVELDRYTYLPGETFSFGAIAMQNTKDSEDFKLTLQYNSPSGTNYECIAQASGANGEWVQLLNTSYTIPENSWSHVLYVETSSGTADFFMDGAFAATDGVSPDIYENAEEAPAADGEAA